MNEIVRAVFDSIPDDDLIAWTSSLLFLPTARGGEADPEEILPLDEVTGETYAPLRVLFGQPQRTDLFVVFCTPVLHRCGRRVRLVSIRIQAIRAIYLPGQRTRWSVAWLPRVSPDLFERFRAALDAL